MSGRLFQFVMGKAGMNGGIARAEGRLRGWSAAAEELQIAAFDECNRVVDQTVGRTPGVGVFPLDRWKLGLIGTQNFFGDIARTTALLVNVEGMKKLNEPALALRR